MEIFHITRQIDTVGFRRPAYIFSGLLTLISVLSLIFQGLNFGIDFAGGALIQVKFPQAVEVSAVRHSLDALHLGEVMIQEFGTGSDELIIRVPQKEETEAAAAKGDVQEGGAHQKLAVKIMETLKPLAGGKGEVELRRVEFVGPQVGKELTQQGILAVFYALIAILIYVGLRFEYRFALGAVLALFHDVIITIGFFSVTQRDFNLTVVAAILTIIGYSINDTIVVFDRVREESRRYRNKTLYFILNESVTQTLSRTIITSGTVVLVLIALLLFGGEVIFDFSLALFIGVTFGTYSSVFIASHLVYELHGGSNPFSHEVAESGGATSGELS
ncbi:MAG: protein translocase subunit SecF [Magnetococcales bacterium]|nr:protein translocase subunit SecF [Magnetococcales bacterium]